MKSNWWTLAACVAAAWLGWCGWAHAADAETVRESARDIPVAQEVDVVVVGGSTGAVAAAVSAAEAGAKVFLAAPRPYLGDDMTATLRLWLEEGEEPVHPLAKKIFTDEEPEAGVPDPNRLDFVYQADRPSAGVHKDTSPPSRLSDGLWGDAPTQSVQYDGDVTILAELREPQEVAEVRLMAYWRLGGESAFRVKSVTASISDDKKTWKDAGAVTASIPPADALADQLSVLSVPIRAKARYVKVAVAKADDVERILLGEIEIVRPGPKAAAPRGRAPVRPMHVKKTLDDALLAAGAPFLYSCYVTDIVRDASGNPCGVVMANRAGRQVVLAKVIIDATEQATVARLAGAKFYPYPSDVPTFRRVVIGGEVRTGEHVAARVVEPPFRGPYPNKAKTSSGTFPVIEYTLEIPMPDDTWASWARADQQARSMTYHPEQQFTSDVLSQVPPTHVIGQQSAEGPWQGAEAIPLGAFRPANAAGVFVLSGWADVPRPQAEKLMRPLALIDAGARLGAAAAAEAKVRPRPSGARVTGSPALASASAGDVREFLVGVRPIDQSPTISQDARALPVLGRYDVVVVGGGTGGAPAGIGAARQGAKTLVIEYLSGLGGVGTTGAIAGYYFGNRVGFCATVEDGSGQWVIEQRMEWWRKSLLDAGADIWFATLGCGVWVEDGQVKGVVVATPQGRGVVLAKTVIDATGNSDVAVASGARSVYTDAGELAMQGTGLPPRQLGATYANTDFTITDETDILDVWHVLVYSKNKYARAFDQGQLVDTRERRRIVGDFTMTLADQILGRTYPDTIEVAYSNFDSHGYTIDPLLEIEHPDKAGYRINVPYRCLLPKGLEGILVVGLGVSAHRDAIPMIRMQPDIQNQGYAAGAAAAMAAKDRVSLRQIDIRRLQQHLIDIGNLPESVLTDKDSFPLPTERIAAAVASVKRNGQGAAVLVTHREQALPLLRDAYQKAEGKDKLAYAHVLAVLGDATGVDTLIAEVKSIPAWDKGWDYRGMGQFGRALSPLDELIVALGRTGDRRAVPAILEKLSLLGPQSDFSHHRAVGLALELIGDPSAAQALAGALTAPGMSGYVHDTVQTAGKLDEASPGGTNEVQTRRDSLRELFLARALYRCGDYGDIGKQVLNSYTKDLRGHLARHAKAVLEERTEKPKK